MAVPQINITLGTAGHIDHGKTALVKCLTGCETDRLKEEKERGMSIDLGYAPCTIADMQVGMVDVPGHENFVKTMVAGASGMDGVILVVAADDGIMPQTREHLDILTLLGIRHGLIALTKIDRVSAEHLELARSELEDYLRGTFLEGAPILPVSNITGQGFDRLLEALWDLVKAIQPKRIDGVFRVPLDRAFSVKGHGTVIAGIPVSGSAHLDDEIVLLPQGTTGRIKRIQVYGRNSDTVKAGQCAAINVSHWEPGAIGRGDVVALPGYFAPQEWFNCTLRLLPHDKLVLKNGAHVKFHTGTTEVNASVYPVEEGVLQGGGEYLIQVRTEHPVVAGPSDHYILRTLSPVKTVGGGMILEGTTRRLKRNRPNVVEDLRQRAEAIGEDARFVEHCLKTVESLGASPADLAIRAKVLSGRVQEILECLTREKKAVALAPGLYIHRQTADGAAQRVREILADFHRRSPESPGMTLEQLRQCFPFDKAVVDGLVALMKTEGRLVERNDRLATPEHKPAIRDDDAQLLEAIEAAFRQQLFAPPSPEELVQKTGKPRPAIDKALKILREHQRLVAVEDLLFHREAVDRARQLLIEHITKEGRLESVQFKYLLDTTRKFALPLLDYFDRTGLLRRAGNTRFLKNPPSPSGRGPG